MTAVSAEQGLTDRQLRRLAPRTWAPAAPELVDVPRRPSALRFVLPADLLAMLAAVLASQAVYPGDRDGLGHLLGSLAYLPVYLTVMAAYGLYRRSQRRLAASSFPDLSHLVHATIVATLLAVVASHPLNELIGLPRPATRCVVLSGFLTVVLVPAARLGARRVARTFHNSRVLVIGSGVVAGNVVRRIAAERSLVVVGCVDDNSSYADEAATSVTPLLGGLADVPRIIAERDIDHVVVAFSPVTESRVAELLRSLADHVQISIVPRMFDLLTVRSAVDDLAGLPVVDVAPQSLGPFGRLAKRLLDVSVSGALLMVLSPVMLAIAIAIKSTSPGPLIFSQERAGRYGQAFRIRKFRTMVVGAEQLREALVDVNEVDGPLFKIRSDSRITRVGGFLRKTSLDELPQLFNVLVGQMSLVGPRPFIPSESAGIDGWAARRYAVRPGMTGLWQISGRNDLPFDELRRLDYSYVASWSLWWDLRILWHTPASVLGRRGAY